jgi:CRISPR-associated autoregulator DevR family
MTKKEVSSSEIKYQYVNRTRAYPFLSFGVRFVANVEALNMVESAGNLVRHRTVPLIVFLEEGKYSIRWYPALSGETLAHAFQYNLSTLERMINSNNPRLCYFCSIGEFIKHSALDFYSRLRNSQQASQQINFPQWESDFIEEYSKIDKEWEIEQRIVENCVIEDLGGFVVATAAQQRQAQGISVRRTSTFQFSYAVPTVDAILEGASTTDVQMQVRMASVGQSLANKVNYANPIQAPYNKEIASAVYSFIFNFDADKVGVNSYTNAEMYDINEKKRRINLALDSLKLVIDGQFGASKSRYNPFIERELIIASLTKGNVLFTVSSPSLRLEDFVKETVERAKSYVTEFSNLEITLYVWANKTRSNRIKVDEKPLINYLEEFKKTLSDKRLNIEYIESYTHTDLIEAIKRKIN